MAKRIVDIALSLFVIIISLPFIGIITFLVFLLTGENPVLLQKRKISLDKKTVEILKIRTIKSSKQFIEFEKAADKIFVKRGYEIFVPLFCRWLRKTGLDEILQIINVIKGEMSLVGPRPLIESDLIIMKRTTPEYYYKRTKINSKPGITGYWQIFGDRFKGAENLIELDEIYERQKSISLDLKIIFRTLFIIISAAHSDSIIMTNCRKSKLNLVSVKKMLPQRL